MCSAGWILHSNSVKKQVITRLSGYVLKRSFIYCFRVRRNVEANYRNNKEIDDKPATTTKNKLINDQNGAIISRFKYGDFSANYNSCGAIAIHNAKVLLGMETSLSKTIYDIQVTSGMSFGGVFGSNLQIVPDMMRKYGISSTEVTADKMKTVGIYIVSYWHENPPWNGAHTVTVYFDGKNYTVYNYLGDGTVNAFPLDKLKDRFISCYKIG